MTPIEEKYEFLRQNVVNLGDLVGSEETFDDGGSRQVYEFGTIYFHPRIGAAFECHGLILQKYLDLGEQQSGLGYPTTDESDNVGVAGGRLNLFENGALLFDPTMGVAVQLGDSIVVQQVVVKIEDAIPITLGQGETLSLESLAAALGAWGEGPAVDGIRSLLPGLTFGRVFDSLTPEKMQGLVDRAVAQAPDYAPPRFENFLQIDCPDGFDTEALVAALLQWSGVVETAYTVALPCDPAVTGTTNPLFAQQGYLAAAPDGIGAEVAWKKGADGAGTSFVDLEQGWFLGHADLPANIPLLAGTNSPRSFPHGCAVLGVVLASDNTTGVVGIAPATLPHVISYFTPTPFGSARSRAAIADRIAVATDSLLVGDVLLLEVQMPGRINNQRTLVPVETERAVFEAIRLASRIGVIVVEAAGNGGASLDTFQDAAGRQPLFRDGGAAVGFKDSGAIVVGACTSSVPHRRLAASNFGTRVDCYTWGENIVTTGNPDAPTQPDAFWTGPFFGGTSGASAILAGVCLIVQNLKSIQSGVGVRLGSAEMRRILSAAANGTPSFVLSDQVGSMPDLALILANEMT